MTLIILLFIAVVFVSFISSLSEGVLLSITSSYVAVAVKEQRKYGKLLEHLKDNIDRPLSAILTLNTVGNTLGSAAFATMVHEEFGSNWATAASGILSFTLLVAAEIVPKTLGTVYWKNLAPFSAYFIQVIIFLLYPIVWLSESLTKLLGRAAEHSMVTREEMIAAVELGEEEGALHRKETAIIKNLLTLSKLYVSDIMTPRSVIFALESDMTVEEVHQKYKPIRFSRIPVMEGSLDKIVGLTMRYRIHEALMNDMHTMRVGELITEILTVPERMTVSGVLDYFIRKKEHLALVVDEYGIITGLVTLEDAIETLLGVEIVDELDHVTDMRQYALEQWQSRKRDIRRSVLP